MSIIVGITIVELGRRNKASRLHSCTPRFMLPGRDRVNPLFKTFYPVSAIPHSDCVTLHL